jgi:hypothetical protein
MSNATAGAPSSGGAQKVSSINEVVIRIAGNSQDGIQAIGVRAGPVADTDAVGHQEDVVAPILVPPAAQQDDLLREIASREFHAWRCRRDC